MSRPRDLSFEALVAVTGATVSSERGALNAALAQIRDASPELTDEELAEEIGHRSSVYRLMWPEMALTPTALSKHWVRIPLEAPKPTYPEPKGTECATCQGDKIVVVRDDGKGGEETAPCPDCNPRADGSFWRWDNTRFQQMHPDQVRRRIQG